MGVSYSCSGASYDSLDEGLEAFLRSISFKGTDDTEAMIRSLSFSVRDSKEAPVVKSFDSSGKMDIEGSLSFKGRELGTPQLSVESQTGSAEAPTKAPKGRSSRFKRLQDAVQRLSELEPSGSPRHAAAVKLQKVYKSFRTRRRLADCAVLVEQRWWKLLDFALLKRTSVSFFDIEGPESVISRWSRARTRAAMVGKGLSKDEKARKLALQHWLEAIDPRHRYGHNLHFYYVSWLQCESRQPFFYWLDVGEGKEVNLETCPRPKLQQQCIRYLGPKEREAYEVILWNGKFVFKQSGQILDTSEGPEDCKWIFVLSTSKKLYVGQKQKGTFQHSSFLAGGATSAAGRLVVEGGILKAVWPHSGHYRPTEENFEELVSFLQDNHVDLTDVKKSPTDEDEQACSRSASTNDLSESSLTSARDMMEIVGESKNIKPKDDVQQPPTSEGKKITTLKTRPERHIRGKSFSESQHTHSVLLKEVSAFQRIYALCIQNLFREFEGDSDEEIDEKIDETKNIDGNKTMERPNSIGTFQGGHEGSEEAIEKESASCQQQHYMFHKRNLFEEDQDGSEGPTIPKELILRRINSKKGMKSYQLGKQLSCKWTTGAGPRIGCVRDYPSELQVLALEQVHLSPRSAAKSVVSASSLQIMGASTPTSLGLSLLREATSTTNTKDL